MKMGAWSKRAAEALKKYQYVLLVALAGVVLLLWPSGGGQAKAQAPPAAAPADQFQTTALERRLEEALSRISGAGEVSVVLTLKETPRQVVAQDGSATEGNGQTSRELTTVLASGGSGTQEPVLLQQLSPVYQGALVVAQGGGDPNVRLALSGAVSALTGLGTDKIAVCAGK